MSRAGPSISQSNLADMAQSAPSAGYGTVPDATGGAALQDIATSASSDETLRCDVTEREQIMAQATPSASHRAPQKSRTRIAPRQPPLDAPKNPGTCEPPCAACGTFMPVASPATQKCSPSGCTPVM